MDEPLTCVSSARARQGAADRRRRRPLHRVLQEHVSDRARPAGLRIVVDCAHGAGYHVAPPVFHELGAEVIAIGNEPDGTQHQRRRRRDAPAASAAGGAASTGRSRHRARRRRRPAARWSTATAALYDGDQLLYVIAMDYRRRGALSGGVVGTLMTQPRVRAGARARGHRARARARSATATCWSRCRRRAGCSAARIPATCSASTSTRPATRSSRRSRCCAR